MPQVRRILNDLRMIDSGVDQYAIETNEASRRLHELPEEGLRALYNTGKDIFGNDYGA